VTLIRDGADLGRIAPASLGVVLVILIVFLGALVAPLYLLGASILALVASLGLATYMFQDLLGYGELTYYVPFAAALLLVSLGSDYNVFLAGRIWAEARRRHGPRRRSPSRAWSCRCPSRCWRSYR
jgi:putative drug exporter of the RND superfamily